MPSQDCWRTPRLLAEVYERSRVTLRACRAPKRASGPRCLWTDGQTGRRCGEAF